MPSSSTHSSLPALQANLLDHDKDNCSCQGWGATFHTLCEVGTYPGIYRWERGAQRGYVAGSRSHNCKCQSQDWNPGPSQTPGFMGLTTVLPWLPLASLHSLFWVVLKTRLNWPISQGCPLAGWGCPIWSVGLCGRGSWQRRDSYMPLPFFSRFSNSILQIQPRSRPARPDRPPCLPGTLVSHSLCLQGGSAA